MYLNYLILKRDNKAAHPEGISPGASLNSVPYLNAISKQLTARSLSCIKRYTFKYLIFILEKHLRKFFYFASRIVT